MLYTYEQCKENLGSDYQIKKAVAEGRLFKKEKGVYSDKKYVAEVDIICLKYPDAIFTMNSAFYYYGMTDVVPEYYYLQTRQSASKIRDSRVKQIFENSCNIELGKTTIAYNDVMIQVYNKERLFVELIRDRSKLPLDYYKEIINSYRKIVGDLDIQLIEEYALQLPKTYLVLETLQMEVL